jgi:hypothetical protein
MVHFWGHSACDHNQTNQQWQRTQPQMGFFLTFWIFHRKEFLMDFFCNMFFKILTSPPIYYITCVNSFLINTNFLKCTNSTRFYVSSWKMMIISNHAKKW